MQFEPEESSEQRRRRQRDYHAFLDAQVQARKRAPPADNDVEDRRFPSLSPAGGLHHDRDPRMCGVGPRGADYPAQSGSRPILPARREIGDGYAKALEDSTGNVRTQNGSASQLEQRLEAEIQQRFSTDRKVAVLGQTDIERSMDSHKAWKPVFDKVRDQARSLGDDVAGLREWRNRVEATLSLGPKMHQMTQLQIKALEEEARSKMQAEGSTSSRLREVIERVSSEVHALATQVATGDNVALQRVSRLEVALAGEAKGAREATKQLREQLRLFGQVASGCETDIRSLHQAVRGVEKFQQDEPRRVSAARVEEQMSRDKMKDVQDLLLSSTNEQLAVFRNSFTSELSDLTKDTATRVVGNNNVPEAMTALRGRVDATEARISKMADKSFRCLEDEMNSVRSEVARLESRMDGGPVAAGLNALATSTTAAQAETQSQLTELQDALSAEITARRRNAVRLAEANAAGQEMGRESDVQMASGLRARCLELEELVARLTQDIRTAQDDLSSQTRAQLAATQERNSRSVAKLEDSLAGLKRLVAQQEAEKESTWAEGTTKLHQLEALIAANKENSRGTEGRARDALLAVESRQTAQEQRFKDKLGVMRAEELTRTEALEQAHREGIQALREAITSGDRINRARAEGIHAEVTGLEEKLKTIIADSQMEESGRFYALLQDSQDQVNRDVTRLRQDTNRVAVDTNVLKERMHLAETAHIDAAQVLRLDMKTNTEACEVRTRLWTEDRMRKERAILAEDLERAKAQNGIVRALLDEGVKTLSGELTSLREESRGRDVALEDLLDERVTGLEAKLTFMGSWSAKKRRLSDLSNQTGAKFEEVARRMHQAEQELKDNLEVKLALFSLVSTVTDRASAQQLDESVSRELRLGAERKAGTAASDENMRDELRATNVKVAKMREDLKSARGWQEGDDELEHKLMARIEEFQAVALSAREAAIVATADVSTARKAGEELAKREAEEAASRMAQQILEAAEQAAAEERAAQQLLGKSAHVKKITDFTAMNDELEADDSSQSSSSSVDEEEGDDGEQAEDVSDLQPRVGEIEEELQELKRRLEEGLNDMQDLKRNLLAELSMRVSPARPGSGMPSLHVNTLLKGNSVGNETEQAEGDRANAGGGGTTKDASHALQNASPEGGKRRAIKNSDGGDGYASDEHRSSRIALGEGVNIGAPESGRGKEGTSPDISSDADRSVSPTSGASISPLLSPTSKKSDLANAPSNAASSGAATTPGARNTSADLSTAESDEPASEAEEQGYGSVGDGSVTASNDEDSNAEGDGAASKRSSSASTAASEGTGTQSSGSDTEDEADDGRDSSNGHGQVLSDAESKAASDESFTGNGGRKDGDDTDDENASHSSSGASSRVGDAQESDGSSAESKDGGTETSAEDAASRASKTAPPRR